MLFEMGGGGGGGRGGLGIQVCILYNQDTQYS